MKTLIVYYSLEGNTEYAANRIAEKLGADTLRLYPVKEYKSTGAGKFLDGGHSDFLVSLGNHIIDLNGNECKCSHSEHDEN